MSTKNAQKAALSPSPGRVSFLDGVGDLPMLEVTTAWSTAEVYFNGAHVTEFRKHDETSLLFMSQCSRFVEGQPIRGGIPVIFPWFGPREGMAQHGFARNKAWDLKEVVTAPDGRVSVRFRLPDCPEASTLPPFTADYTVTVDERLSLRLDVTNRSPDEPLTFENCLHSYFQVGDISTVSITGLKGVGYLDKVHHFAARTQTDDVLRVESEVDRVFLDTAHLVEIEDPGLHRRIRIEKTGSLSTVVWNPWVAKAQQMPDFGTDEYRKMVCVESGNVASNQITLAPGGTSTLTVVLSSQPLV